MIWICTISLLILASWLFFNALNERRWVEAHNHDETVASDKGLFPSIAPRPGTGAFGDKFFESKVAAARITDPEHLKRPLSQEDTFFGRAVATIGEKAARVDAKLDIKMKEASSQISRGADGTNQNESSFARASRLVSAKSDEISQRVARGAKNMTSIYEEDRASREGESGMFGKMVGKVSGSMDKFETKIDARVGRTKTDSADLDTDLMSRVAAKVGRKVSEMDDKFVKASKSVASKLDKN